MAASNLAAANANVSTRDQRVVVAGATGGIGLGVALQFATTGAEVWIIGRNATSGECSTSRFSRER